jgi:hypothetical protein
MRIHFQIAITTEGDVRDGMFGEERQHVIEERYARANLRAAFAVKRELDADARFFGLPFDRCLTDSHGDS